jgi:phosphoglycolate phosphatase-like HAD superfamily hydrolase
MRVSPARLGAKRYVLFEVDGTLNDALDNQRRIWRGWAERYGLDPDEVHQVALRTRPMETFAQVVPDRDPQECLAALHELEDEDVRSGVYAGLRRCVRAAGRSAAGGLEPPRLPPSCLDRQCRAILQLPSHK